MESATLHLRSADPVMAAIIERVGPCVMVPRDPTFETLARSITLPAAQREGGRDDLRTFAPCRRPEIYCWRVSEAKHRGPEGVRSFEAENRFSYRFGGAGATERDPVFETGRS